MQTDPTFQNLPVIILNSFKLTKKNTLKIDCLKRAGTYSKSTPQNNLIK